jgi:hypothetical protein
MPGNAPSYNVNKLGLVNAKRLTRDLAPIGSSPLRAVLRSGLLSLAAECYKPGASQTWDFQRGIAFGPNIGALLLCATILQETCLGLSHCERL